MILVSPGDIFLNLGTVKIYYYGIIMAASILLGLLACKIVCKHIYKKIDFEKIYNLALGSIISGLLGARIYYAILNFNYFKNNLSEVFAIQHGGMTIHGAILGGVIFALIYLKIKKLPVLKHLDILTFGLITGQIIGRWGNFFNSEAFGLPTNLWLKLYIPVEKRPIQFADFEYFHPTFLYESVLNIFALSILILIAKRTAKSGYVTFSYILLYSIIRFFIESIRTDSVLNIYSIPVAQLVGIIGIITGIIGLLTIFFKNKYCTKNKNFVE